MINQWFVSRKRPKFKSKPKSEPTHQVQQLVPLEERLSPAAFTPGNIVVVRVGDGTASLTSTGNAVFLDEFTPTGSLVQSIAMPTTSSGTNRQLILSGTATSEGMLSRSVDGRYLLLTGYGRDLGGSGSLSSTTSATVNRVIGRVDALGNVDTSTALTDFSTGNNPRSVASTNGVDLWMGGGSGGVRYSTIGSTTSTQLNTTLTNVRQVQIFDEQLYVSNASGTNVRIQTIGTGLPVSTGQSNTGLPNFNNSSSTFGYFFADLSSSVPGVDTLYVANDDSGALQKWSLVSGNWTQATTNGTIGVSSDAFRGLTGFVNPTTGTVTLYATIKGSELVSIVDTNGYNAGFSSTSYTVLATAGTNTAFRGVALAPEGSGVIGDRVYHDLNNNGKFDTSETTFSGVTVSLFRDVDNNGVYNFSIDTLVTTTTTDTSGQYRFTRLTPGQYFVQVDTAAPALSGYQLIGGVNPVLVTLANTPTGTASQFDFSDGDYRATFGIGRMQYVDIVTPFETTGTSPTFGTTTLFGISDIGGVEADVIRFNGVANARDGLRLLHGSVPNGGSTDFVNRYTLVFDLYVPTANINNWTPLFNTDYENFDDGDAFIRPSTSGGGVGISGQYAGTISGNTWHRVAITVDTTTSTNQMRRYIDGTEVGSPITLTGLDGRWSLYLNRYFGDDAGIMLFGDDDSDVNTFYVSSIFYVDRVLSTSEISSLGGPNARGIILAADRTKDFRFEVIPNDPPVVTASSGTTAYSENNPPVLVDPGVIITDSDSANFNTGFLRVEFTANGTADDRLVIVSEGTGSGQINVSGSNVQLGSSVIGTFTGGTDGSTPLVITFTSTLVTPAVAQQLARRIGFENVSDNPSTATRTVRFTVDDGDGGTSAAAGSTKTISVTSVADTPSNVSASTNEDTQSAPIVLSPNPADGASVTHFRISGITNGSLFQNDGITPINNGDFITVAQGAAGVRFTPAPNYSGPASFQFQAALSNTVAGLGGGLATASITVLPVNDAPVANNDSYTVVSGQTLNVSAPGVKANDTDIDNPLASLVVSLVSAPAVGVFTLNPNGSFSYTAPTNFTGSVTFTYQLNDGLLNSNVATVTITVTAAPPSPPPQPPTPPVQTGFVAIAPDAGNLPIVRIINLASGATVREIMAYDSGFTGGVRVAMGDVNGDGTPDLITAAGPGGGPHVKVFDGVNGGLILSLFAYASDFTGGVYVAAGDLNGDGRAEIITGTGIGGGPHVKVFDGNGNELGSFFAYEDSFRGGVLVTAGDLNGDGRAEIITGSGVGGGPVVNVIDGQSLQTITAFFAFDPAMREGVVVTALNGQLFVASAYGSNPTIRGFSPSGSLLSELPLNLPPAPSLINTTEPLPFEGVRLTSSELADGQAMLIVGSGPGRPASLLLIDAESLTEQDRIDILTGFLGGVFVGGV